MNRRQVLWCAGVGIVSPFAGCLTTASDEAETPSGGDENASTETKETEEKTSTETNETEETEETETLRTNFSGCTFHIELIEDPPKDAPGVSAEEEQLLTIDLIARIFEKATDPKEQFETTTRKSGEYETFWIDPKSDAEHQEVEEALESLPGYGDPDYPPGVYLTTDSAEVVVAITQDCLA